MQATMTDKRWYSAFNVIIHFHNDFKKDDTSKFYRKAKELYVSATALVGFQEVENKQYWIQAVSDAEGSPDTRTITCHNTDDDTAPNYTMKDVEVVTYEHSTGESLIDFLLRTKFSKGKSYDNKTTILLYVKEASSFPSAQQWFQSLNGLPHLSPVIILGRYHKTEPIYTLIQVYPQYKEILEYNLPELLSKQEYRGVLNLSRGTKKKEVYYEGEEHCPFESLGFQCKGL